MDDEWVGGCIDDEWMHEGIDGCKVWGRPVPVSESFSLFSQLMHLHFFNLLSLCFTINFALSISLSGMCGHPWLIISAKDTDSDFGNITNLGLNILKLWCVFPFPFWCDVGSSGIQLQVLVHHFREIMAGIQAASHTTSIVKIKEKIYTSLLLSSLTVWDSPA